MGEEEEVRQPIPFLLRNGRLPGQGESKRGEPRVEGVMMLLRRWGENVAVATAAAAASAAAEAAAAGG